MKTAYRSSIAELEWKQGHWKS